MINQKDQGSSKQGSRIIKDQGIKDQGIKASRRQGTGTTEQRTTGTQ
jgi:hypothetical protein